MLIDTDEMMDFLPQDDSPPGRTDGRPDCDPAALRRAARTRAPARSSCSAARALTSCSTATRATPTTAATCCRSSASRSRCGADSGRSPRAPRDALGRGIRHGEALYDAGRSPLPYWGGALCFRGEVKEQILRRNGGGAAPYAIVERHWQDADRLAHGADLFQKMTYLELKQRLPELLLMRLDKITMANSVEGREPFLDQHLVEFALALPPAMKYRRGVGKYVLKRAMSGLLPEEVLSRPKQGFGTPMEEWLRGPFGIEVQNAIRRSSLAERGLLDYRANRRAVRGAPRRTRRLAQAPLEPVQRQRLARSVDCTRPRGSDCRSRRSPASLANRASRQLKTMPRVMTRQALLMSVVAGDAVRVPLARWLPPSHPEPQNALSTGAIAWLCRSHDVTGRRGSSKGVFTPARLAAGISRDHRVCDRNAA